MNDKLEKKEWWDLLKGASFFAVVLTLIVNEYSYKSMDSTIYVIACVAELLIFLSAIGVDYVRYVVMNEPIKKERRQKDGKIPFAGGRQPSGVPDHAGVSGGA